MAQSVLFFSENLLNMMRGALMMFFILMAISLFPRRKENSILGFLFSIIVTMTCFLVISLGFMVEGIKDNEYYYDIVKLLDMCLIPLIGGFFLTIILPDYVNERKSLILLIPSVVLLVTYSLIREPILYTIAFIYTIFLSATVFAIVVVLSVRYDYHLKNNFSNIDNRTVGWVRTVVIIFVAWLLAWNFIIIHDNPLLDSIYYLFLISIWTFIYKYSIKHVTAFDTQELFENTFLEERENIQTDINSNKLVSDLDLYMEKEQPWMNPSLSLQELAAALKTNRTYLSEYFNKQLGTTFYDYLNTFRIKHACEILQSMPSLSIIQVGESSGFNSLSTFRRAFEKQIGCTPAKYRKQNSSFLGHSTPSDSEKTDKNTSF